MEKPLAGCEFLYHAFTQLGNDLIQCVTFLRHSEIPYWGDTPEQESLTCNGAIRWGEVSSCMLVTGNEPSTTGANVNIFKFAAVCVAVVAICGCDQGQPTTPVEDMKLTESADSIGMEFKLIPAGTFIMGEGDEAHEVTLTRTFKMGVHEITQAQYEQVMKNNPSKFKGADHPVEMVSWDEAVEFCRRLSEVPAEKAAGNVYRLPTEAEWEYACRAGTATRFSFGDEERNLAEYGWYHANSDSKTHPVGAKQPNAWGLYDLNGNVWEWCSDLIDKDYMYDPPKLRDPILNVCRGGAWNGYAHDCRPTSLTLVTPGFSKDFVGFRVVRESSTPIPTPVATNVGDI